MLNDGTLSACTRIPEKTVNLKRCQRNAAVFRQLFERVTMHTATKPNIFKYLKGECDCSSVISFDVVIWWTGRQSPNSTTNIRRSFVFSKSAEVEKTSCKVSNWVGELVEKFEIQLNWKGVGWEPFSSEDKNQQTLVAQRAMDCRFYLNIYFFRYSFRASNSLFYRNGTWNNKYGIEQDVQTFVVAADWSLRFQGARSRCLKTIRICMVHERRRNK